MSLDIIWINYGKQPVIIPEIVTFSSDDQIKFWIQQSASTVSGGTVTEIDPIFRASAAFGISASDITNWNGKTSNVGTITGINMNGSSKGTSGVVDLGTVVVGVTLNGSAQTVTDGVVAAQSEAYESGTVRFAIHLACGLHIGNSCAETQRLCVLFLQSARGRCHHPHPLFAER